MKNLAKTVALMCLFAAIATGAQAAKPADEIKTAIEKGDYKNAQTLVSQNPEQAGAAELQILDLAEKNATKNPEQAKQLMTLASNLSTYISVDNAPKIADQTKKLVEQVVAASKPKEGQVAAPKNTPNAETVISLLNSALTIAQAKAVAAVNEGLASWIEEQLADYAELNDVLLAQTPVGPRFQNSNFIQFIPPSGSGGSPF